MNGKKLFSKISEEREGGGMITKKSRVFSSVETGEKLQKISQELTGEEEKLTSTFAALANGNDNFESMLDCRDNVQGLDLKFSQGLTKMGYFPIPSNVVSGISNMMEVSGKSPEKRKKISIDAANFVYTNGILTATDGESYEPVGNFALKILKERRMVDEIFNEANELIGTKKKQRWKVQIIVTGNAEYEGNIESGEILGWVELRGLQGIEQR